MATNGRPVAKTEEIPLEERSRLYDIARKLLLGSVGAVALAQDEVEDFVNKLVERGEMAEKDGRKLVEKLTQRGQERADKEIEEILHRMDIPTQTDIEALSEKIVALTEKVEALKKAQS